MTARPALARPAGARNRLQTFEVWALGQTLIASPTCSIGLYGVASF